MARRCVFFVLAVAMLSPLIHTAELESKAHVAVVDDAHGPGDTITIKLRPSLERKKEDVRSLGERLKGLPEFAGVSIATISRDIMVLTPSRKHSMDQLKQLLLQQAEVYELEVGEQLFRRDGDKPYSQLRKDMLSEMVEGAKSRVEERIKGRQSSERKKRRKAAAVPTSSGADAASAGTEGAEGNANDPGSSPAGEGKERARRRASKPRRRKSRRRNGKPEGTADGGLGGDGDGPVAVKGEL